MNQTIDPTKAMSQEDFHKLLTNPPEPLRPLTEKVRGAIGGLQQLRTQRARLEQELASNQETILRQEGAVTILQQLLIEAAQEHSTTA